MNSKRISAATVLVVDDQESLTRLMSKTLENAGFHVLWANNGADALTLFRAAEPPVDLLVTDYRMPGMTGLELASECCSLNPDLGVLYVSGSSPGDDLQEDLAIPKRDFLPKPFRQSDLLRSAKAVLAMEPEAAPSRENHWPALGQLGMES
jgi:two-component system cell cycle response regulator CpdR